MNITPIDLSIIIVSFNTRELLEACLKSIFHDESTRNFKIEVIVVDNGSSDGSSELMVKHFPNVQLIANKENVGFSRANNIGVNHASGNYVLLLNSDTELQEGALAKLYTAVVKAGVKIASCQLINPDGTIQPQGGYLPSLLRVAMWMLFIDDIPLLNILIKPYHMERLGFFRKDRQMGWVGGTALMVNKKVYDLMHGLDEEVFMYAEDVEFCWRARQLGHAIHYFSQPKVMHLGHQSGSAMKARLGEIAGLIHLYKKHQAPWRLAVLRQLLVIGSYLRWVVFGMILGNGEKRDIYKAAVGLARQ